MKVRGPKVARDLEALKHTGLARQDAIGDAVTAQVSRSLAVGIAGTLAAVVLGLVLSVVVGRGSAKPILAMTAAMDHLAKGDKTTEIPAQGRTDEVGLMATAVQVFKDNMIRADTLAAEQEHERKARQDRAHQDDQLTRHFTTLHSRYLHHHSPPPPQPQKQA